MRLAIFDIDNTLTESRSVISPELAKLLSELIDLVPVALISGESLEGFQYQVVSKLTHTKKENLYLLPTAGAMLSTYADDGWKTAYAYQLNDHKRRKILEELARVLNITPPALGRLIEDRGTLITYAALGKDAPLELKYAWDPTRDKRRALVAKLSPKLHGVSMSIGGSTSIDFTEEGIDKAFGVEKLLNFLKIDPADTVFVGDALAPGGNDESVRRDGVETIETKNPEMTKGIVKELIEEAKLSRKLSLSPENRKTAAFFCMEYGMEDDLPIYAGGLGILAGDMVRAAGKRPDLNFVAFGLIARKGMRTVGNGVKDYTPEIAAAGFKKVVIAEKPLIVTVPLAPGRDLAVCAWEKRYGTTRLILLDSDLPQNKPEDRTIMDHLYDFDMRPRVYQELVLGAGGVKILNALGIVPDTYHLNEGHASFGAMAAILEDSRTKAGKDFGEKAKLLGDRLVATKHTILSGAGTYITHADFEQYIGTYIRKSGMNVDDVFAVGALDRDKNVFSATKFLLTVSARGNGVSVAHVASEKRQYSQSTLIPITNSVDRSRWQARFLLDGAWKTSDEKLFQIKRELRSELVAYTNKVSGSSLAHDRFTVVWARRFVAYKRPGLLISDEKALLSLVNDEKNPVQFIIAGRAPETDVEGTKVLKLVERISTDPAYKGKVAHLPDYTIESAKVLVRGADVWLNTPIPGFEACGTSGMKAGLNGGFVMSTDDGWVSEVPELHDIGCIISEADIDETLYTSIRDAADLFYKSGIPGKSKEWVSFMRKTMLLIEEKFGMDRMIDEYVEKLYHW